MRHDIVSAFNDLTYVARRLFPRSAPVSFGTHRLRTGLYTHIGDQRLDQDEQTPTYAAHSLSTEMVRCSTRQDALGRMLAYIALLDGSTDARVGLDVKYYYISI